MEQIHSASQANSSPFTEFQVSLPWSQLPAQFRVPV